MSGAAVPRSKPGSLAARAIVGTSFVLAALVFGVPLAVVIVEALSAGLPAVADALRDADTLASMRLTLFVVAVVLPFHLVFGIAVSWAVVHHDFWGKKLALALLDLPFTISPVVAGLLFVLLFGSRGIFGSFLLEHDIRIIFAIPGIVLSTMFVTVPFVARELIPLMQAQGSVEEEAAASLGAPLRTILWRVTLPRVRWGLFYGGVLCAARAAGEFGAVSVVSARVRGETTTMPLQIEILSQDYQQAAAFSVALALAASGILTLIAKSWLERRAHAARYIAAREAVA